MSRLVPQLERLLAERKPRNAADGLRTSVLIMGAGECMKHPFSRLSCSWASLQLLMLRGADVR